MQRRDPNRILTRYSPRQSSHMTINGLTQSDLPGPLTCTAFLWWHQIFATLRGMEVLTVTPTERPEDRERARTASPNRRGNPHGWQYANHARRRRAKKRAWAILGL